MRVRLDGSWALMLEDGSRLTPAVDIGLRHDGGDAETGFGLNVGGGGAYAVPARGLTGELNGRWLLAHSDDDFREWGVSGSLLYDPEPGIVTLINGHAANWHRTQTHAAAVTVCHRSIAWLRNWRKVLREIRWRWTLKVL